MLPLDLLKYWIFHRIQFIVAFNFDGYCFGSISIVGRHTKRAFVECTESTFSMNFFENAKQGIQVNWKSSHPPQPFITQRRKQASHDIHHSRTKRFSDVKTIILLYCCQLLDTWHDRQLNGKQQQQQPREHQATLNNCLKNDAKYCFKSVKFQAFIIF